MYTNQLAVERLNGKAKILAVAQTWDKLRGARSACVPLVVQVDFLPRLDTS